MHNPICLSFLTGGENTFREEAESEAWRGAALRCLGAAKVQSKGTCEWGEELLGNVSHEPIYSHIVGEHLPGSPGV